MLVSGGELIGLNGGDGVSIAALRQEEGKCLWRFSGQRRYTGEAVECHYGKFALQFPEVLHYKRNCGVMPVKKKVTGGE